MDLDLEARAHNGASGQCLQAAKCGMGQLPSNAARCRAERCRYNQVTCPRLTVEEPGERDGRVFVADVTVFPVT